LSARGTNAETGQFLVEQEITVGLTASDSDQAPLGKFRDRLVRSLASWQPSACIGWRCYIAPAPTAHFPWQRWANCSPNRRLIPLLRSQSWLILPDRATYHARQKQHFVGKPTNRTLLRAAWDRSVATWPGVIGAWSEPAARGKNPEFKPLAALAWHSSTRLPPYLPRYSYSDPCGPKCIGFRHSVSHSAQSSRS